MTEEKDRAAEAAKIIRNHMVGSVAAGVLPIPLLDIAILEGIQFRMLSKLAAVYDVEFSEQRANAIVGSLAGVSMTAAATGLLWMVPGIGKALAMVGGLTLSPASTYAVGQIFTKHFESGGTFLAFNEEQAKKDYVEKVEEGKAVVAHSYAGIRP